MLWGVPTALGIFPKSKHCDIVFLSPYLPPLPAAAFYMAAFQKSLCEANNLASVVCKCKNYLKKHATIDYNTCRVKSVKNINSLSRQHAPLWPDLLIKGPTLTLTNTQTITSPSLKYVILFWIYYIMFSSTTICRRLQIILRAPWGLGPSGWKSLRRGIVREGETNLSLTGQRRNYYNVGANTDREQRLKSGFFCCVKMTWLLLSCDYLSYE